MKLKHTLAVVSVALLTMAGTGFAADTQDDPWRFGVTLPIWAVGIDGDVTVRGNPHDVNLNFSDLRDHLDASFSLGLEARKEKFGFFGGVGYMKFSAGSGSVSDELKFLILDAGGFYRLFKSEGERPFILEATAGIRYWRIDNELTIKGPTGNVLFQGSNDPDLLDPVFGLRGSKCFSPKLHLDFQGDMGGFGLSDNQADLDWSLTGLVGYDFRKWFTLSGGYKAVGVDVSSGGGAKENGVDLILNGFLITAKFKF